MSSFRIVDTRFRILKGGKIGLAASIALIGGMLTLGSTSANAANVTYNSTQTVNSDPNNYVEDGLYRNYDDVYISSNVSFNDTITTDDVFVSGSGPINFNNDVRTGASQSYYNDVWNLSYGSGELRYTGGTATLNFNDGADLYGDLNFNGQDGTVNLSGGSFIEGDVITGDNVGTLVFGAGAGEYSGVTGSIGSSNDKLKEIKITGTGEVRLGDNDYSTSTYVDEINFNAAGTLVLENETVVADINFTNKNGTVEFYGYYNSDADADVINFTGDITTTLNNNGNVYLNAVEATVNGNFGADGKALNTVVLEDSDLIMSGNIHAEDIYVVGDNSINMGTVGGTQYSINSTGGISGYADAEDYEDVSLTIKDSNVIINADITMYSDSHTYYDEEESEWFTITNSASLIINDSSVVVNGDVNMIKDGSADADLHIIDSLIASTVEFNGEVNVGNDITITNNIVGEDAYTLVSEDVDYLYDEDTFKWNYVPNSLATKVEFNANVTTGNDLSIDNAVVNFGNLESDEIDENAVVVNIGNDLILTNSYVTLNGDLNVEENMTIENSYGHFTASGDGASVTVGNNLTINDQVDTDEEVSFITFDSKVNVGEDFIITGNDKNIDDHNVLPQGENTTVILNDTVTVGNDLIIDEAFVSIKGDGEDSLIVGNDVTIGEDSFVQITGGDITIDNNLTLQEDSALYVGINYYDLMTDMYSDGVLDGDYSVSSTTEMTIGGNLLINDSFAWLGNEAMNGEDDIVSIAKNTVNVTVTGNATIENDSDVTIVGDLELTGDTSILTIADSDFDIIGATLLSGNGDTAISIDNSDVTFDGTVTVLSTTGDLSIIAGSDVTFKDNISVGRDITIADSDVYMGTGEDSITVSVGRDLKVEDSDLIAHADITVANNVDIYDYADVEITGNLTLTGEDSTLSITDSEFTITGATLLSSNDEYYSDTSISISNSTATFDGTVTILSEEGDLSISNGSTVVFKGEMGEEETPAVFVGGDVTIADSTVTFGTVDGEDNISALTSLQVGDDLYIDNSIVRFGSTVDVGDDLDIYGGSEVTFEKAVTVGSDLDIDDSIVTFNDTVDVTDDLEIIDSTVTFEKAVTIADNSYIYSYDSFSIVHFKDTLTAYDDIFVYGNTTLTLDKGLTITGEDGFGTLHIDDEDVTIHAKDHVYANVRFSDDGVLNVSDTKNIYGITTASNGDGILNFLGTTTLFGDIGEDSAMLSQVSFAATGEDAGSFTQNIGYDVYSYNTYIGNGNNKVRANITNDITFGGDLQVRNGSTLNVSDKDINVGALYLDSGSTTSFKVYTTDITSGQAVENANSGSITTNYLSLADDAKFNITYDGSWYGAGKYNLIEAGEDGFVSGEDYLGTEANGLVTDNSIIDSVIKRFVDEEGNEFLSLYADRTGDGSYDAKDLYIKKSGIGNDYSNGASQSLAGYADGTKREGALADIIRQMEDLEDGITISAQKKQQMQEMQRLLAPTANNSAISASLSATNLGLGTIAGRIADVRGGAGAGGNILAFNDGAMTGLSAGEETLDSSLWIKAIGSTATQDKVEQYDGYKSNTYGIVAGADKTLKNGLTVGFALAYADTSTKQKDLRSGDDSDTNTIQATAYASKEFGNLYVDGMLSYANHSTDAVRTANSGKLTSDVKADQLAAKVETGYRFVVGEATTLTPFASLEYSMLDQKAYTEKGTVYQNDALKVDSTKLNKGTVGLGTKLATNVKAGDMTLIPELTVGVYNSFGDDSTDIKAQFVGGGNKFVTPTQELNETMINIGAGVKMSLSDTSSLILDIDHDRSSNGDFEGYSGSVSYRLNF